MNVKNLKRSVVMAALITLLAISGCAPTRSLARVGALRSESQSVELGDATSVRVEISMGAGELYVSGGAEKLLDANFTYNVDRLKPQVTYRNGALVVRQPDARGMPSLQGITDFRNEWDLRLYDDVPLDLSVEVGGGTSNLQLDSLSLSGLKINLGAGDSTVDLSGAWSRDLDVTIDVGAAITTVRLPRDVGARVEVDAGASMIDAQGMTKDGNVYTNAAYGVSDVTLNVALTAGIGKVDLEVAEAAE
jgi:hypothetical protein